MKTKLFLSSMISTLLIGCGGDGNSSNNEGSVSITGTAAEDQTLSASVTDADGLNGVNIVYDWFADGEAIEGATRATIELSDDEVGKAISVRVVYTDEERFTQTLTSTASALVAAVDDLGTVQVEGTAAFGETLTATVTDLDGLSGTISYQWLADNENIDGATANSYQIGVGEIGKALTVSASYVDDQSFQTTLNSTPSSAVPVPDNTAGSIAIDGLTTVGEILSAAVTDADGIAGDISSYQWAAAGVDIAGATANTYPLTADEVGDTITVSATYTDNLGVTSTVISAATAAVSLAATNAEGRLTLSGNLLVGEMLSTDIDDSNGATGTVTYTWMGDGMAISDADDSTFVITDDQRGQVISVSANYTDDDGFSESLSAAATDVIFNVIVDGETALVAAVAAAEDGDWIGLGSAGSDDYADMAEIEIATANVTLAKPIGSTAVISGTTCLVAGEDGVTLTGLSFDDLDFISGGTCDSNGDGSLHLDGTGVVLSHSEFLGQADGISVDTYNWITVKGYQVVIERNRFTDGGERIRNTKKGAIISIFTNEADASQQEHTIRYNVFEDIGVAGADPGSPSRNSSAYAIQLGRSTGSDSNLDGNNTVAYNLFQNTSFDRRSMRVQSVGNTVDHNTFLDTSGYIGFENGSNNTASNNIFINSAGDNSDDGGIAFTPFGHTISNNYIAGLRTTSGQRAALLAYVDSIDDSGNSALSSSTVTLSRNTVLNSRQALQLSDNSSRCSATKQFIIDADGNLIANGEDDGMAGVIAGQLSNGEGETAIRNDCALSSMSDFDNNHIYSETFQSGDANTLFSGFAGAANNVGESGGNEGNADVTINSTSGLLEGQNSDANIGADTSVLELLDDAMVGPNSDWTP